MADNKQTNKQSVEETNRKLSEPVTNRPADTGDGRNLVRAPKDGVEGSNFDGGTKGEEKNPNEETVTTDLSKKSSTKSK